MGKLMGTINDLGDAYDESKEDNTWIKAKLMDLEDGSRHNNVKLRGIPESVLHNELQTYAHILMFPILPAASPIELTIYRIHRIP